MKDYKRLTKWSDLGTLHIFDINGKEIPLCEATPLDFDNLAGRLADLEDKIESGELCDRKEVERKTAREIFEELYDDISPIFHSVTLSKDTIKDRAEAYGVILEDEE